MDRQNAFEQCSPRLFITNESTLSNRLSTRWLLDRVDAPVFAWIDGSRFTFTLLKPGIAPGMVV